MTVCGEGCGLNYKISKPLTKNQGPMSLIAASKVLLRPLDVHIAATGAQETQITLW